MPGTTVIPGTGLMPGTTVMPGTGLMPGTVIPGTTVMPGTGGLPPPASLISFSAILSSRAEDRICLLVLPGTISRVRLLYPLHK